MITLTVTRRRENLYQTSSTWLLIPMTAEERYKNPQSDLVSLESYFSDYADCKRAIQDVDVGEFQSNPVSPDAYFSDY